MNLIFKKRQKRQRILEGRQECHGTKYACQKVHATGPKPYLNLGKTTGTAKKIGWFRRLINFFKLRWFLITHPTATYQKI